jgi:hypothetical protein
MPAITPRIANFVTIIIDVRRTTVGSHAALNLNNQLDTFERNARQLAQGNDFFHSNLRNR